MPSASLTARQAAFVREYVKDSNGTQAAIRAGYSPKGAHVVANRLLRNITIKAKVGGFAAKVEQNVAISRERVLRNLAEIANVPVDPEKVNPGDIRAANMDIAKIQGWATDATPGTNQFQINIILGGQDDRAITA